MRITPPRVTKRIRGHKAHRLGLALEKGHARTRPVPTRQALGHHGHEARNLLLEHLNMAVAQAARTGERVAALFIDLDRFKNVNDTLGHRIGDELLKHVTRALSATLRETDLLARLGGDEFMVIVEDFDDPQVLGRIAQKLLDAIARDCEKRRSGVVGTRNPSARAAPASSATAATIAREGESAIRRLTEPPRGTEPGRTRDRSRRARAAYRTRSAAARPPGRRQPNRP